MRSPRNIRRLALIRYDRRRTLSGGSNGALGHNGYQMGTVFGTGMNVAVEIVGADGNIRDRVGAEIGRECLFHFRHPEHSRTGAGYGNAHALRPV